MGNLFGSNYNNILQLRKKSALSDKKTENTSLTNLMYKKDNFSKVISIISVIILLISIFLSILLPLFEKEFTILTYNYKNSNSVLSNVLSMNVIMLYILLGYFISNRIYYLLLTIKDKDSIFMKIIFSDFKFTFLISEVLFALTFVNGLLFNINQVSIFIAIFITLFNVICIGSTFKWVKAKMNLPVGSYITIFSYVSVVLCFNLYFLFCNICEIVIYYFRNNPNFDVNLAKDVCVITTVSFISLAGIMIITFFKDILFQITYSYLIVGFWLSEIKLTKAQEITVIVNLSFSAVAIVITLIKYGKESFGFEDDMNEELFLKAYQHKSSWCSNEKIGYL